MEKLRAEYKWSDERMELAFIALRTMDAKNLTALRRVDVPQTRKRGRTPAPRQSKN